MPAPTRARALKPHSVAATALWTAHLALSACTTAGSAWIAQPLPEDDWQSDLVDERRPPGTRSASPRPNRTTKNLGQARVDGDPSSADETVSGGEGAPRVAVAGGRSLGTFRNTYYDLPNEGEFAGPTIPLKNASCQTIREVPRGFFETLCVQGSGTLTSGPTVSFARRDCACAEVCPRTAQRICFDALDAARYPWGRGATGKPITPLLTVAVDSDVIPLNTALYVPEYDGLPRDVSGNTVHDGCFVAEDRGIKVKGKHVDVFTGHSAVTTLWNKLVPSNRGVTVILDSPRCRRGG